MTKSSMLPPSAGIGSNDKDAFERAGGADEVPDQSAATEQMQQEGGSPAHADGTGKSSIASPVSVLGESPTPKVSPFQRGFKYPLKGLSGI